MIRTDTDRARLRAHLLAFYDRHHRELPWRGEREPYRIWVSEVMLQQTKVETVEPYYRRWMERFPTLDDLAEASREEVLKAWEGLGYYSRARRIHEGARMIRGCLGGELPSSAAALRELPGVGEYTAGAVASIAFGEVTPAIDGNARRVLCRLFDLSDPRPAELRALAESLVDPVRPGDFNQAVMELGATVCTPRAPKCAECQLEPLCRAATAGTQLERPRPRLRPELPLRAYAVAVVEDGRGRVLLSRRPDEGLLGGLWEFPNTLVREDESNRDAARRAAVAAGVHAGGLSRGDGSPTLGEVRHTFSHFKAVYRPVAFDLGPAARSETAGWATMAGTARLPMPVPQRSILARWAEAKGGS